MAYQRKAASLSDFEPIEGMSEDGLLKVTFENGQAIFVHDRGIDSFLQARVWVLHEDFCPSSLAALREPGMDYSEDIKGRPYDVPIDIHVATVGEPAEFYVHPSQYVLSVPTVVSIEPCAYRDAYHDDLAVSLRLKI